HTLPEQDLGAVGLIQPNEAFREKWDPGHLDSVMARLVDMSRALRARTRLDLLLWPEAAVPGWLAEMPGWDAQIAALARTTGTPILTGTLYAESRDVYYNAAFFYDSTGRWRPYPIYAKHYLVPVVERVPFVPVRLFRSVPGLGNWSGGFAPGPTLPLYRTSLGRFGVLICYESAFEDLARRYRRAGADFLVNITNDAWYGRTAGPYQHAAHLVMRAIETRTGIARAANDGISEFVDPLGRTYDATDLEVDTAVAGRVRTSAVVPPYVWLGDWVGALCVLASLGFAGALAADRWRTRGSG
ncbi:MAG TPA: apolipoprotein N-acyltransferase, partial [Gemmatimonadales bacterium]|nr:apolipoprotein N-acyltransferase [Gemmatimonadales bacterium]